ELGLCGPLVGLGYLNRPELSRERFFCCPETGKRYFLTGDLRQEPPVLRLLGRKDDQVKIRGQRIELGEIESCL
ncbi:unnamed protein product, partial [Amoebophrya sp. A25]